MSRFYQLLCTAIRQNDAQELIKIGEIINQNTFTPECAELCSDYQDNTAEFINILHNSSFDVSSKDNVLKWIYQIIRLQSHHATFASYYMAQLKNLISDFQKNPDPLNELDVELTELNNSYLATNSIFIYLALVDGGRWINTSTLPLDIRNKFLSNIIDLAKNFISTYKCENEYKIARFFTALVSLNAKGFTTENLTEILRVHPVWALPYASVFYEIFKDQLPHEELQALIVQVRFVDWVYITKASLSNQQKKFIIDHIRNYPTESLGSRAYNSIDPKTVNRFKLAYEEPLKYLIKEEPAPIKVNEILQRVWRMSPLPGGFFSPPGREEGFDEPDTITNNAKPN